MFPLLYTFVALLVLYWVYNHYQKLNYWKKKNVPHLKPMPVLGNYKNYILQKEIAGVIVKQICEQFPEEPYIGAYYGSDPALIIQDPDFIKLVITKDFNYFSGREASDYNELESVTKNIFFTCCDKWKVLRQNLTPLFTSAKMKNMFPLIEKCTHVFEKVLNEKVRTSSIIPINPLMAAYTMDCIGSCAFGVDTNVMAKPENNVFWDIGKDLFAKTSYRGFTNMMRSVWPRMFYSLGFKFVPSELHAFFLKLLTEVFQSRQYKPSSRNDIVDIVLAMANNNYVTGDGMPDFKTGEVKKIKMEATDELLAAQCLVFFAAGFETSATTSSFTIYELAKNQKAQERVLEEVDAYWKNNNNQLNYNVVTDMPYLDACIDETLRFYPIFPSLSRETMADYTFPTGLRIEKGTRIHIPVYHLQRLEKHFPEPEVFRPERFLGDEKSKVDPHVYMPFGGGPRLCIGMLLFNLLFL